MPSLLISSAFSLCCCPIPPFSCTLLYQRKHSTLRRTILPSHKHNISMITFHRIPVDIRIEIYEYVSGEPIVHYIPTLWLDTSVSSGRWLVAAKVGDLHVLQALLEYALHTISSLSSQNEKEAEERKFKTVYLSRFLAQGGHFQALQWAHSLKFPMDAWTFAAAIAGQHIPIMLWLRQEQVRCPWDSLTFTAAAETGRLDILQWLHRERCPWDKGTFTAAVGYGDVDILTWLREQGCPWDLSEAWKMATEKGRMDLVQWLQEEDFYRGVNAENNVDILRFL